MYVYVLSNTNKSCISVDDLLRAFEHNKRVSIDCISHAFVKEKSNSPDEDDEERGYKERQRERESPDVKALGTVVLVPRGLTGQEGDNCRRVFSHCSYKEVLRRDKAPAITIEPRGNFCLRVTRTHSHTSDIV